MKKIIFLAGLLLCCTAAFSLKAQTTEEILTRMGEALERSDGEGCYMVMDIKMPIVGTVSSATWMLGDKFRIEMKVKGKEATMWSDGKTDWEYNPGKNEITISDAKEDESSDAEDNMEMFDGITDGYDVILQKQTASAWYFLCKKQKGNTDRDAPKKMDLVVSKATYLPISLKATLKGVTVTLRDIAVGVREDQVTFNRDKYPNARIVDKRKAVSTI